MHLLLILVWIFLVIALSIQFGGLLQKPLWATQWWNIHSPCSTSWSRGWNIPPHHSILNIFPSKASADIRVVLLRNFQQGHAIPLRRARLRYSGGHNYLRRFCNCRGLAWTLGLKLQEEAPTVLIYYLIEFGAHLEHSSIRTELSRASVSTWMHGTL